MDTNLLYPAFAEKELEDCLRTETRLEWQRSRSNDCVDSFTANDVANFFPWTCFVKHKQNNKRKAGLFKEEFRCMDMLCLFSKHTAAMTSPLRNLNLAVKVSTNAYWNRVARTTGKVSKSLERKSKRHLEQKRIPNKQSLCCYLWTS